MTALVECSMIDSTKVPAASKTFAPPFATEDAGPWSSVYSERFGFGETWFEHMRRPSSHSEIPPSQTDGGGLLEGPCSEQVKTDSQKIDSLPQSSSTSVQGSGGTALPASQAANGMPAVSPPATASRLSYPMSFMITVRP